MNIQEAISRIEILITCANDLKFSYEHLGEMLEEDVPHLLYLVEFAKTVATVPTPHDAEAEMDEWDSFFETLRKAANGNR